MTVFFIIFPALVQASRSWKDDIKRILEFPEDTEQLVMKLQSQKNLDEQLRTALKEKNSDAPYALEVIRVLNRKTLTDDVITVFNSLDASSYAARKCIKVLIVLDSDSTSDKILKAMKSKIDFTSPRTSSTTRLLLLHAMKNKSDTPTIEQVMLLGKDDNYDLRVATFETVKNDLRIHPEKYEKYIHQSLTISPYTLRLKAIDEIAALPFSFQKKFKSDFERCSAEEKNDAVKSLCQKMKASL